MEKTRERLLEYVCDDKVYREYKKGALESPNDFELFCIEHCEDIEKMLKYAKKLERRLQKINDYVSEFAEDKIEHDKFICGNELEELYKMTKGE